ELRVRLRALRRRRHAQRLGAGAPGLAPAGAVAAPGPERDGQGLLVGPPGAPLRRGVRSAFRLGAAMHVVFIEPRCPGKQSRFVRALAEVGATVTAIGEGSKDSLDGELKHLLTHYEQVGSVVDEGAVLRATRTVQSLKKVDRLEAVVEAHIMCAAK